MNIEYIAFLSLITSGISVGCFLLVAIRLYFLDVELNAMKKSTHKIQWMPVDQGWAQNEQEVNKAFESDQGHPEDLEGI